MTPRDLIDTTGLVDAPLTNLQEPGSVEPNSGNGKDAPFLGDSTKRIGFLLLNVWLVFHLFAIFIGPASGDPASSLTLATYECISPYLHLLYLDHGFHYFVPEPGPSTLVTYELDLPDGSTKTGQIPNREMVPRLYYHRHFMVTEFLGNGPEEFQPLVARAIARNLCRETGATSVKLTRVVHQMASIDDIRRGLSLNDPIFFKETPLGTFTADELQSPYVFPVRPTLPSNEVKDLPGGDAPRSRDEEFKGSP